MLLATALGSRLGRWVELVAERRAQVAADTQKEERGAVATIERYWAMYRFRRWRRREMAEANAAATRIQRQFRVKNGQNWLQRRRRCAEEVLEFLRVCLRTNRVKQGVQKYHVPHILYDA